MEIHKTIILDENQQPVAVQIPIEELKRLQEVMGNYALSKLMDEVADEERLPAEDAKACYRTFFLS